MESSITVCVARIQAGSERAHLDQWNKCREKKAIPVFHLANSEIQPAADTEGQLCKDGSQKGVGGYKRR